MLVLGENERLEALAVDLVRRQGDAVLVRAPGLDGREVVLARTPVLGAGIRVNPVRPDASGAAADPETITLDPERRARLIPYVESNGTIPTEARARMLDQLRQEAVPAPMVARLESRMGS